MCMPVRVARASAGRVRLVQPAQSSKNLIKAALVIFAAVVLVAVGLTGVREVSAAPAPLPRGERALKAIEALRMKGLMNELRADKRQRKIIRQAFKRGLERKQELLRERAQLLRKMQGLVLAGEVVDIHKRERIMRELALRFRQIEREIAETRWSAEEQILDHLTPPQRIRYILFNERFERELRERIETLKQRRYRGAPPSPPPDVLE